MSKKQFLGGKNSNAYIVFYSTVMVVIVAIMLAFTSLSLKEKQNAKKFTAWMEMGRQQGLFREDADFEILTFILKRDLTTILEVKLLKGHTELSKYTLDELGRKLFLFYLRGISTPRGQQIIEDYLKENEIKIE